MPEFRHISGPAFPEFFVLIHPSRVPTARGENMACFKERKIPKHLVIQDDYEFHHKGKNSLLRIALYGLLFFCLSYSVLLITP
ncbi:MAG: hypothetical protein CMP91_06430 [Gammaproteobacteria bacterium]|nr:hypothetical protein [Gammaproteobacteria bacterium]MAY03331.1 hypothetical protein [Gammaproteobacteria bacterium]|tara:strand:+ start:392 stop:640 length:249 start_codon:yes stop_codon:yes gene_type:complete